MSLSQSARFNWSILLSYSTCNPPGLFNLNLTYSGEEVRESEASSSSSSGYKHSSASEKTLTETYTEQAQASFRIFCHRR